MRLQEEVAQIQHTLHSLLTAATAHKANPNFDTPVTTTTNRAHGANLNAPISIDLNTGIATNSSDTTEIIINDAASTSQEPVLFTASTDTAGITGSNTDPSIAFSEDTAVVSSKLSCLTVTITGDTDPATNTISIAHPAPIIHPLPRPPPEPDPHNEGTCLLAKSF